MKTIWKVLIGLLILIIAIRIALPFVIEDQINKELKKLDEYDGRVEDVDLFILGGHFYVKDIKIWRIKADSIPFVSINQIDVGIDWSTLFQGKLLSTVFIESPKLNFIASLDKPEAGTQDGGDNNWPEAFKKILPAELDRFELVNGQITFKDFSTSPNVDVSLDSLYILAENLSNRQNPNDTFPSHMDIKGVTTGNGHLKIKTDMNILKEIPDVKMEMQYVNANLMEFNDFVKAYGNFDLEKGHLSVFSEVEAMNGQINGYVKPYFDEVIVLDWSEDKKEKGFFHATWEAVVGLFKEVPEDQQPDVIATKVPFQGKLKSPDPDISVAILNLLKNAFIEAITKNLDHQINVVGQSPDRVTLQSPPFEE